VAREKKDKYHELSVVEMKHESAKAYCFLLQGVKETVWLPKSQCDYNKDSSVVHASEWIIRQKPELEHLIDDTPDA